MQSYVGIFLGFLGVWLGLDCVGIGFVGMDVDGLFQVYYEDFVVIDFVGIGCFGDCFDDVVQLVVGDCYVDFYFGQEVDDVFGVVIQFGVVFLLVEIFDFGYCDVLYIDFG